MSPKGRREASALAYTFGSEKQWVGIDVCQKYLDVYIRPLDKLFQVTNDEVGINKLVQTLVEIQPELIVLEATGEMEIDAAIKLTKAKKRCSRN
jgi:transposase